ncbi:hypothetical protein HDEF_1286 [Candidatus Hamiltonella defensa 5AT (Acyrthosiphon pisum)]|uniref:Uncharacterized protein n=1 Tax=Hamiltonella defensa subsp. Acyrthosiphon pisum (strain 5AT) TaxID=572265 RepID=C4K5U5_HAMD5|nr:hypothetical protein HDEF_1286 [Candidatus Hamiltonella defensa 5AT (Acyrthosiphon pisum)]
MIFCLPQKSVGSTPLLLELIEFYTPKIQNMFYAFKTCRILQTGF